MKGSFRRNASSGTWYLCFDLGPGPNGRRRQIRVSGKTKTEARAKAEEILARERLGVATELRRMTMAQLFERFLEAKKRTEIRTIDAYEATIRLYLKPAFANVRVADLNRSMIESAINDWIAAPRFDGRPGKRKNITINATLTVLHTIMQLAVDDKVRPDNPVAAIKKLKKERADVHPPTPSEAAAILERAEGTDLYAPLYIILACGGARRGEVVGLQRGDYDRDSRKLEVRCAVVCRRQRNEYKLPKSDAGIRPLFLPALVAQALEAHLDAQYERLTVLGVDVTPETPLFDTGEGGRYRPDPFYQKFTRFLKRNGLPHVRLHGLRHGYATLGLRERIETKITSTAMGHENTSVTRDRYQHVDADLVRTSNQQIVDSLERLRAKVPVEALGHRSAPFK